MANYGGDDIDKVITGGIVFHGGSKKKSNAQPEKVKTKAKKKAYVILLKKGCNMIFAAFFILRHDIFYKKTIYFATVKYK